MLRYLRGRPLPFLAEEPPKADEFVMPLGKPPNDQEVVAKIVRVVKTTDGDAVTITCFLGARFS